MDSTNQQDKYLGCVQKYFQMDPETDDLLPSGRDLIDGMVVLHSNDNYRALLGEGELTPSAFSSAMKYNRWCTVANLNIDGENVYFIAEYEDGTKRPMVHGVRSAWYVKLESILPAVEATFDRIRAMAAKATVDIEFKIDATKGSGVVCEDAETPSSCEGQIAEFFVYPDEATSHTLCFRHLAQQEGRMIPSEIDMDDRSKKKTLREVIDADRAANPLVDVKPKFMGEFEGHPI